MWLDLPGHTSPPSQATWSLTRILSLNLFHPVLAPSASLCPATHTPKSKDLSCGPRQTQRIRSSLNHNSALLGQKIGSAILGQVSKPSHQLGQGHPLICFPAVGTPSLPRVGAQLFSAAFVPFVPYTRVQPGTEGLESSSPCPCARLPMGAAPLAE